MKSKLQLIVRLVLALSLAPLLSRAQATSRVIPFSNIATTLPPCAAPPDPACPKPVNVTVQVWQDATSVAPADLIFPEAQPSASLDDAGSVSFVFGSQTAGGLNPAHFPSGSSRFLDVVDPTTGTSVLSAGRIPLNANPFALSPGPVGPAGPPGVVQTVAAGDASITVGGTAADRLVAIATNGVTNAKVADGALSPAKITGTAATLGPNNFVGNQNVNGAVNAAGPLSAGANVSAGGNLTMVDSTAGAGNILKGGARFIHNFGGPFAGNTFIGQNAGNLTMTGIQNTANGFQALFSNTTGGNNTASGFNALVNNTTGTSNTASGVNALLGNTTGNFNTASGARALEANTTGEQNTANGAGALFKNTTGGFNTASGSNALQSNTTGVDNTAVGAEALFSNTTIGVLSGSSNTAVGRSALRANTTGDQNTANGAGALFKNTTGGFNTASGVFALMSNTNGLNNTASGVGALQSNTAGNDNTASGASALFVNTTGFDNTAVGKAALFSNTTSGGVSGSSNTAVGRSALVNNTTGGGNTASGVDALFNNTTGSNNTAIGKGADVAVGLLSNATAIGAGAIVDASNKIRLGNSQVTVVEGPPYSTVSDRNQKENFQPVEGEQVLRKVGGLSLTSWNYIGHDPKQFRHYGPVAQEFFAAFGHDSVGTIGTDTTINSGDMEGILMIAVQALEKRTEELGQEKQRLTETVEALKAEVKAQRQHREVEQREQAAQIAELQAQLAAIAGRLKRLDRQDLTAAVTAGRRPTP